MTVCKRTGENILWGAALKCSGNTDWLFKENRKRPKSVSGQQLDAEVEKNQQRFKNAQQLMLDGAIRSRQITGT